MKRLICIALLAAFPLAKATLAGEGTSASATAPAAVQKLTFTNKLVGGKKTWLPAAAKVKAGTKLEITLTNELKDPHGFRVNGLVQAPVVVKGGETQTVMIDAPKAGTYQFDCQLHPAHVGGQIIVE